MYFFSGVRTPADMGKPAESIFLLSLALYCRLGNCSPGCAAKVASLPASLRARRPDGHTPDGVCFGGMQQAPVPSQSCDPRESSLKATLVCIVQYSVQKKGPCPPFGSHISHISAASPSTFLRRMLPLVRIAFYDSVVCVIILP